MKFTSLLLAIVFSGLTTMAAVVPNEQDIQINEPKFAKLIYKAYVGEAEKNADGSITFSNLLSCSKTKCVLHKGQWLQSNDSSAIAQAVITPKEDSAVFDLGEYMKVKPSVSEQDGVTMSTKELSVEVKSKHYALSCITAVQNDTQELLMAQCTLLNGLQN